MACNCALYIAQVRGCAANAGAAVSPFPLDPERGWRLDLAALEAAVTPNTHLIAVTNPHNPVGTILTGGEMDALVAAAAKVGAWLLADKVYRGTERLGRARQRAWRPVLEARSLRSSDHPL